MTNPNEFTALLLEQDEDRKVSNSIQTLSNDQLPEGDVTIAVKYSTLAFAIRIKILVSVHVVRANIKYHRGESI